MVMPGLNGVELQRRLRARHPRLETLFVSGYTAGAVGASPSSDTPLLSKPFTPTALLAAVWSALHEGE